MARVALASFFTVGDGGAERFVASGSRVEDDDPILDGRSIFFGPAPDGEPAADERRPRRGKSS